MKNILILCIGITVCLSNCNNQSEKKVIQKFKKDICFCDSITYNFNSDSLKEYYCYKKDIAYKFQETPNYTRLSRHYMDADYYLAEVILIMKGNFSKNEKTNYAKVNNIHDSVSITYIYEYNKLDSIRILISKGEKTIFRKTYNGNTGVISKELFKDTLNEINIKNYYSDIVMDPKKHILRTGTLSTFIDYTSASYFLKNSMDSVLIKIKKCISNYN